MTPEAPVLGSVFASRYRIDEVLGQGGMGVVVGALDQKTGVPCAIKILRAPKHAERMLREARALMLLSSPHIVRIFDVGEQDDGQPYLVLEHLRGRALSEMAPLGERLPPAVVTRFGVQICEALAVAHARGIVHRDIKLSNLFVIDEPDGRQTIKLLDFGISKLEPTPQWSHERTLTEAGTVLGSPHFMSPEQLRTPHAVDARTDLWAVGVVLFRLLTGRFPFDGETKEATFEAILASSQPPEIDPAIEVPPGLRNVVARCLTRELSARYDSAEAVANDLRSSATAPVRKPPRLAIVGVGLLATLMLAALANPFRTTPSSAPTMVAEPTTTPIPVAPESSRDEPQPSAAPVPASSRPPAPTVRRAVTMTSRPAPHTARSAAAAPPPAPNAPPAPTPTSSLRQNPYL
jgi:serine/threonine-protein kinase